MTPPAERVVRRRQTSIVDQMLTRDTRQYALEVALCAYAVIAPDGIPSPLELSPTCALVLDAILAREYADPSVSLVACVIHATAWERPEMQRAAADMAQDAADITVQDLASIGDVAHIVVLLCSERYIPTARSRANAA